MTSRRTSANPSSTRRLPRRPDNITLRVWNNLSEREKREVASSGEIRNSLARRNGSGVVADEMRRVVQGSNPQRQRQRIVRDTETGVEYKSPKINNYSLANNMAVSSGINARREAAIRASEQEERAAAARRAQRGGARIAATRQEALRQSNRASAQRYQRGATGPKR